MGQRKGQILIRLLATPAPASLPCSLAPSEGSNPFHPLIFLPLRFFFYFNPKLGRIWAVLLSLHPQNNNISAQEGRNEAFVVDDCAGRAGVAGGMCHVRSSIRQSQVFQRGSPSKHPCGRTMLPAKFVRVLSFACVLARIAAVEETGYPGC